MVSMSMMFHFSYTTRAVGAVQLSFLNSEFEYRKESHCVCRDIVIKGFSLQDYLMLDKKFL